MRFDSISAKQLEIFKFAHEPYDALICDGAVRSGKTVMMLISFVEWAMRRFNGCNFAICGKTVRSAERNIIMPLLQIQSMTRRYRINYTRSVSLMSIERGGRVNFFYIFGGRDESSYMLIQGITLAGVLLDEVALMPQSFVEQAITRTLSVDEAKLWFNCNPESLQHWFYLDWVLQPEKHNAKRLHFLMEDNPSLSVRAIERAKSDFSGVFYERYILGEWVKAQGRVYPMFGRQHIVSVIERAYRRYYISIDYGTHNPCSMGLWGLFERCWYRIRESYYDSRREGSQRTDEEHYAALTALAGKLHISDVVVDPSAASFLECIRRHGRFHVRPADNDVLNGIQHVAQRLQTGTLLFNDCCKDSLREFELYAWDEKCNQDKPIKENDHAMDEIRYFVNTILDSGRTAHVATSFIGGGRI